MLNMRVPTFGETSAHCEMIFAVIIQQFAVINLKFALVGLHFALIILQFAVINFEFAMIDLQIAEWKLMKVLNEIC